VAYSLHLQSRTAQVVADLQRAMNAGAEDIASAALAIARVEYPSLDPAPYVEGLARMGQDAAVRVARAGSGRLDAIRAFNEYLYDEQGFVGNREHYDDPRNSPSTR
jgi:regulator of sirC expression with transglutaminase-like and TPR domain